ncbi:nucleolar transcription factor 1-A-like [Ornithodoros turicata]|uniref:nucleolar transcription factor 1-A-like n=1 Tax=Ornithodoros turicata TaxID=34597 RepID=UPI0031391BCC
MATTAAALPTVPSRRKSGSKRSPEDVEKDGLTPSKRVKVKAEPPKEDSYDVIPPEVHEVQTIPSANTAAASKGVSVLGWSTEELNQLLQNLEKCLPANDTVKYTTMVEKVDWEKVRFSTYSAAQCKEKWSQLMQKLRRYRTLTDLVTDAHAWLLQPLGTGGGRRQNNPALPKKPLTPYFRFFVEKRAKYARENPDLSMSQLSKLLSSKYQQLSDKKKQKYKDSYDKEKVLYDAEMKEFKKEHPEEFPEPVAKPQKVQQPLKPQPPFKLFAAERMKRPEFEKMEKKEVQEELRKQWANLSDGKRLKWIRRAVQAQNQYQEEVAECPGLKLTNPKPILSKAEQEFKDKCEGKPQRPPNSGYSLFSRIMLRQLKNVPAKEKMAEISRLWKALATAERDDYNKQAVKANAKYKEKYATYLSNLPEEERIKLENEALAKSSGGKKTASPAQEVNGVTVGDENQPPQSERPKPKKPLSAMFFFQQEKVAPMREKHPDMSKQEIMRLIAREFSELPDRKKEKYQKMAEEAKQKALEETNGCKTKEEKAVPAHPSKRQKLYKGEPKKPPQSGYGVFSTEMLSQLVDVDPKLRMAEIAKRWNAMTDEGKEHYKNMVQELQRKYAKELRKFLENLSPEERQQYEELQARLKDQRKGGTAATKVATAPKAKTKAQEAPAPQEEASSSSSSESSSEEESSSDEDDEVEENEDVSAKQKVQQRTQQESEEDSDSSSEESESSSESSSSSDEEEEEEKSKGATAVMHKQVADMKKKVPEKKAPPTKQAAADESSSSDSSSESSDDDDDDNDSSGSDSDSK